MLAQIRKLVRKSGIILLLALAAGLVSCASEKHVALVNDPDAQHESQIPWNKQEKWENAGALGAVSDRR